MCSPFLPFFLFSLFCLNHLFPKHVQPEFAKVVMTTIGADTIRVGREKARAVRNHIPSVFDYTALAHKRDTREKVRAAHSKNRIFKNGYTIYISPLPFSLKGHLRLNNFFTPVRSNQVQIPTYAHPPMPLPPMDSSTTPTLHVGAIAQVSLPGTTCPP